MSADTEGSKLRGTKRQISEVSSEQSEPVSQPQAAKRTRMASILLMPLSLLTAPARLAHAGFQRVFVRRSSSPADRCQGALGCTSGSACKGTDKADLFEDVNDPGQFYCAKCWEDDAQAAA